jgi:hypothetical protein
MKEFRSISSRSSPRALQVVDCLPGRQIGLFIGQYENRATYPEWFSLIAGVQGSVPVDRIILLT